MLVLNALYPRREMRKILMIIGGSVLFFIALIIKTIPIPIASIITLVLMTLGGGLIWKGITQKSNEK